MFTVVLKRHKAALYKSPSRVPFSFPCQPRQTKPDRFKMYLPKLAIIDAPEVSLKCSGFEDYGARYEPRNDDAFRCR